MDVTTESPERARFDGVGTDSLLKQKLSDMADEVGARNTRVAIAVPVKEIIRIFHEVFANVPHVPDYDAFADGAQRWGGVGTYSPGEVPDPQNEVGVRLTDNGTVEIIFETFDAGGGAGGEAPLTLEQAEEFFLRGLSAVAEGKRRVAARPVVGISDEDANAELARRGIVIEAD